MFYSTESQLLARQPQLQQFWHNQVEPFYLNKDGYQLFYCVAKAQAQDKRESAPWLLLCNGRIESSRKYLEIIDEAVQNGYNVLSVDHQGQGYSSRLLADAQKGYVGDFDDYVDDLAAVIADCQQRFPGAFRESSVALAHSMGCAILLRYLQRFTHSFCAAALSAPMLGIYSGPLPFNISAPLCLQLCRFLGEQRYFIGQQPYSNKVFAGNELTHSAVRYRLFRELYQQQPQLQLGGVTVRWLQQAIHAIEQLHHQPETNTPLLLLQAEQDTVVSNVMQNLYINQVQQQQGQIACYHAKGARHEILCERDDIRQPAMQAIYDFMNRSLPTGASDTGS